MNRMARSWEKETITFCPASQRMFEQSEKLSTWKGSLTCSPHVPHVVAHMLPLEVLAQTMYRSIQKSARIDVFQGAMHAGRA